MGRYCKHVTLQVGMHMEPVWVWQDLLLSAQVEPHLEEAYQD
jgi:hypothetical protein